MNGENTSQTWGDIWARSHEVSAPRYEWPAWYIEIHRAIGTTEEEIAAFDPPTEEWTFSKFLQSVCEEEREEQRRALHDWFGWKPEDGPPSTEIRKAFNERVAQEYARFTAERDAECSQAIAEGLEHRAAFEQSLTIEYRGLGWLH